MINHNMQVVKRNGEKQPVSFDKVLNRIAFLAGEVSDRHLFALDVDPTIIAKKTIEGIYDGVTTTELDSLAINIAQSLITVHPDYGILASRLMVSNFEKNRNIEHPDMKYVDVATILYNNPKIPLVKPELYELIKNNAELIEHEIDYTRNYMFDVFGFYTLENKYLMRTENGKIIEDPQSMWMRVSLGIHCSNPNSWDPENIGRSEYEIADIKNSDNTYDNLIDESIANKMNEEKSSFVPNLEAAFETYHYLSQGYFTHATPTLYNAGTMYSNYSSCFLLAMEDDSIEGIYNTLKRAALISKAAGGIGINIHQIRAEGSYIAGTNGTSNGIVPMLRVFNDTALYVDQGGGKRNGAFAIYLEPWHADIEGFLLLKKKEGKYLKRAWDLFYGLWISDTFMKKVKENSDWYLMCPKECPNLQITYGEEHEKLYNKYISEGKYRKKISARELWIKIIESMVQNGTPYILFKDHVNRFSNQQNLGTIRSSNLCTEVLEYSDSKETAVCNLASIALPKFVNDDLSFDHEKLHYVTKIITRNLNKVIDRNCYPTPESARSNYRHRPIGIGVQGLANVLAIMRIRYGSDEAIQLDKEIFETIYHGYLESSCELAKTEGVYPSYWFNGGCPASRGLLKFDLCGEQPGHRWNWDSLKEDIITHGLRNSLGIAPMPTASTSQILGNIECFEPYKNNYYTRTTGSGTHSVVNEYLIRDLIKLGIWDPQLKSQLIKNKGSVQNIDAIPKEIRNLYPTVWELGPDVCIDHAIARRMYIDQSNSMNIFIDSKDATPKNLTRLLFKGWNAGLTTGCYYLRTRTAAHRADVVDNNMVDKKTDVDIKTDVEYPDLDVEACPIGCDSCGS